MPAKEELPPDLAPLIQRQACELTDSRWEYDVEVLTRRGPRPPRREAAAPLGDGPPAPGGRRDRGRARRLAPAPACPQVGRDAYDQSGHPEQAPPGPRRELRPVPDPQGAPARLLRSRGTGRLGVLVSFDFRIQGYRGDRLPLRWQLLDTGTGDQVAQSRDVTIVPEADDDQGTWDVWVPVPRDAGRRFSVQVQLYNDQGDVPIARLRRRRSPDPASEFARPAGRTCVQIGARWRSRSGSGQATRRIFPRCLS